MNLYSIVNQDECLMTVSIKPEEYIIRRIDNLEKALDGVVIV